MTSELPSLGTAMSAINSVDSRIAFELAADLCEPEDICERYSIEKADLAAKLQNPVFIQMFKEFKAIWKSDLSVKERIRIKSMTLVEDSLLDIHGIVTDDSRSTSARLDAFKSLAKVATVDAPDKEAADVGQRIAINISIPGAEKPVTYEGEIVNADEEKRA